MIIDRDEVDDEKLPELVTALETCRRKSDQRCEEQLVDWIGHAGRSAARFAGVFRAMLTADISAGKRYIRPSADLLATTGDFEALRPVFLNPNYPLLNPNGVGVAPPRTAVPFIVALLEHDASKVSVDFLTLMLSCYGPDAMAPAERILVKLMNDPEYMNMQGVNVAMRILRRQQPMSGECVRHSGAWRNP